MSAVIRTVRRLDQRSETRTIGGIQLDRSVPIPPRIIGKIDAALLAMEVGESFEHAHRVASHKPLGARKFTQRRQANGRYRIWRTA